MNTKFRFESTPIEGVFAVTVFNADDERGKFTKDYSKEIFAENGIPYALSEVFYTTSRKGVIRALHFQRVKQQPKLVRCILGHIWDVVVDLRRESKTYKKWISFELTGENNLEILIPAGCAHGYLVLESSVVSYKCAEKFYGEYDDGIRWDDPDLSVAWPLHRVGGEANIILSEKDRSLQSFAEFELKNAGD